MRTRGTGVNLYDIVAVRKASESIGEIKGFLHGGRLDIASLHWLNETVGKIGNTLDTLLEKMEREVQLHEDTDSPETSERNGSEDPEKGAEPEGEARVE